ncbi:MAG TPA: DEAD/DEAH box helicase family protein [Solirubrobacteraceae bacterium]|nr:DEAD/DEAH box helicase family protein [Solirubrobacteraceae bacterium]
MTALRGWQEQALARLAEWDGSRPFLVSAAPGAGKTRPALVLARRLLRAGEIRRVVVVCPTTPLTRQWAQTAAAVGVQLAPDAERLRPPSGFDGVSVTYARAAAGARRWATECTPGTLVVADEAHHLGEDLAWGEGFATAFAPSARWLLLSGTPFRSDHSAIPGVRYEDGVCVPDVTYSYADAVREGVCRPVSFIPYDGTLAWRSGDDVVESSFSDALAGREAGRRYRTSISVELPDGLPRILRAAHARLEEVRAGGHRDAGGLVVAADASHARAIAKSLREIAGEAPTVVLHTDTRAHHKLAAFRTSGERWIVAVNMVSEGVDIPRLRVGVYATAARTALIFRQIVGRFVRTLPDRPAGELSHLFLPADPHLRGLAGEVETELRQVLRPPDGEPGDGEWDEPAERRATEPAAGLDFAPVAADVSPQLALFGGGPPPPTAPPPAVPGAAGSTPEPDEPEVPAYERRARLRDRRHALVSQLRREDGRSHRDINAWLNRATGISRVDDASLDQLQRSIDRLLRELDRRSARRAGRAA